MAPNNALGKPTAARLRASYEGTPAASSKSPPRRASRSPAARRRKAETSVDSVRVSSADGFGATSSEQLPSPNVLDRSEVTGRGTGTAVRTPLEEFEARPRDELRCFWTAVMFLTRLPCPGWCDHHPGYLMRAMAYFPLIGALIGVWAAAIYDAAACVWPPLVAAALSGGGTLWLTGCFHEDGLCDTLDGFGGGWTKVSRWPRLCTHDGTRPSCAPPTLVAPPPPMLRAVPPRVVRRARSCASCATRATARTRRWAAACGSSPRPPPSPRSAPVLVARSGRSERARARGRRSWWRRASRARRRRR